MLSNLSHNERTHAFWIIKHGNYTHYMSQNTAFAKHLLAHNTICACWQQSVYRTICFLFFSDCKSVGDCDSRLLAMCSKHPFPNTLSALRIQCTLQLQLMWDTLATARPSTWSLNQARHQSSIDIGKTSVNCGFTTSGRTHMIRIERLRRLSILVWTLATKLMM